MANRTPKEVTFLRTNPKLYNFLPLFSSIIAKGPG